MIKKRVEDSFCISEATSLKNETEVFEHDFLISSSLKNETTYEDSFFVSVATSLKNETEVWVHVFEPRIHLEHSSYSCVKLVKK
jgi:hypothetical protein